MDTRGLAFRHKETATSAHGWAGHGACTDKKGDGIEDESFGDHDFFLKWHENDVLE
jgi:hypothetical protein